jgi:hypothetical protein
MAAADTPVTHLLPRHGLTPTAARACERAARRPVRDTRRRGVEHAVVLDSVTGEQIGPERTGDSTSVDISPQLAAIQPGQLAVVLHTHPRSSSFSPDDGVVLAGVLALSAMVAVGLNGSWYVLSPSTAGTFLRGRQGAFLVYGAFRQAEAQLKPSFDDRVAHGDLEIDQARRELTHAIWENIAARLGLRYDRLQPS